MTTNIPVQDLRTPMVSQPESADRTLSIRRPPSASSRTTTTRRQRHNRSHNGGSTYRPQNEFPFFGATGDVEIVISAGGQEKRYLLHRLILAQCSGFFEAGTSEEWSRAQAQARIHGQSHGPETGLARIGEDEAAEREFGSNGATAGREFERKLRWKYELDWGNKENEVPMLVQKAGMKGIVGTYAMADGVL